ncbi:MAG: thiamine pyrophosphate-dependent enzyme [Promethearchaeota archaeon]
MNSLFSDEGRKSKNLLISGNEAIVRGLLEAGVGFGSTYPGTPVSDVGDLLHEYSKTKQGKQFIFDYALNEKIALEEAAGASWCGIRSIVIFKHLGMNVASDALHTLMYSGIGNGAGLVIIVGGDPQASSSTNAEDVRLYSKHTHLPILFPSSVDELHSFVKKGYELSESSHIPVMIYTTPKLSFMTGLIYPEAIPEKIKTKSDTPQFKRNFNQFINARHFALNNLKHLRKKIEKFKHNKEIHSILAPAVIENSIEQPEFAVITGGYPYLVLKDVIARLGVSEKIPILKLNYTYPVPPEQIKEFISTVRPKKLLILEELEPMIEADVKNILYDMEEIISIIGENEFPRMGEITHELVESVLRRLLKMRSPKGLKSYLEGISEVKDNVPQREPTFCPGCSHRNVFYALRKVADNLKKNNDQDLIFGGDIGCYTLGMSPPWSVMDWLICMGAGIGISNGVGRVLEKYDNSSQHVVALIGDSTFFHSGIQPLLNALKQDLNITILILNNYYVAMTGHQPSLTGIPSDNQKDAGFQDSQLRLDEFISSLGNTELTVVGGFNIPILEKTFQKVFTRKKKGTRIILVNAECALTVKRRVKEKWDSPRGKERGEELYIQINESCPMCHECFREFGCTAIKHTKKDGRMLYYIDESGCMKEQCQACLEICPNHCIEKLVINPEEKRK